MGNELTGKHQQIKKALEALDPLDPNDETRISTVFQYQRFETKVEFPGMESQFKRDQQVTIAKCLELCAQSKECEDLLCRRLGIPTEDEDRQERQTKASEKAADAALESARSARCSQIAAWVSAVAAILALAFLIWTWWQSK